LIFPIAWSPGNVTWCKIILPELKVYVYVRFLIISQR